MKRCGSGKGLAHAREASMSNIVVVIYCMVIHPIISIFKRHVMWGNLFFIF